VKFQGQISEGHHMLQAGAWGTIGEIPPKTYKGTLFTMILHNSENNIRDIRPF